jgi:hypothetical protein
MDTTLNYLMIELTGKLVRNIDDSIVAWMPEDEPWFENQLAPCRAALSESEFTEAIEQGRSMTMEQAIAYALEGSTSP